MPTATPAVAPMPRSGRQCQVGLELNPGDECSAQSLAIRINESGAAVIDGNFGGITMSNEQH